MFNKLSGKASNPDSPAELNANANANANTNARQTSEHVGKANEKPLGSMGGYGSSKPLDQTTDKSFDKKGDKSMNKGMEQTHDKGMEKSSGFMASSTTDRDAKSSKMESFDKPSEKQSKFGSLETKSMTSNMDSKPSKMESSSYGSNDKQSKSSGSDLKNASAYRKAGPDSDAKRSGTVQELSSIESVDAKVIRIVVLGAGYAGVTTAMALDQIMSSDSFLSFDSNKSFWSSWFSGSCVSRDSKPASAPKVKYEVVLISRMDALHHNVASLRGLVQPSIGEATFIPLTHVFDGSTKLNEKTHAPSSNAALYEGRFIQGNVSNVTESSVIYTTMSGKEEKLGFDFVVIALGSIYASPMKTEKTTVSEAVDELRDYAEKLKGCQSVLIVGGGPVGVELAGEIAVDYPEKKVTLVHAGESLIEHGGVPKLQSNVLASLKAKGVEVLLGHRITSNVNTGFGNKTLTTDKGASIESDAQFRCIGATPNTSMLRGLTSSSSSSNSGSGDGVMDTNGRFKVNSYLQLESSENIFALGDLCNTDETKLGYTAALHGPVVADNVSKLAKYSAELYRSSSKAVTAATTDANKKQTSRKNSMDTSIDGRSMDDRTAMEGGVGSESESATEPPTLVVKPTLTAYKGAPMNIMAVTIGRNGGVTQFSPLLVFGDFVTRMIKAKDLFLAKYWSTLRAGKVPVDL